MKREVGKKTFLLWLLGDSNPKQWEVRLDYPLDARHPIRHNIWTSVLDVIQDRVFRECRGRVDANAAYIRNAVANPDDKPRPGERMWATPAENEVEHFGKLLMLEFRVRFRRPP